MKIITLRSKNGEIIVSELKEERDDNKIVLKDPMALAATETGIGFVPFIVFSDDVEIEVYQNDFFYIVNTDNDTATKYKQQTGRASIVTPPNSGKIITN